MRTIHVVRKFNPAEWGGTETAVQRLLTGLREHDVDSVLYFPSYDSAGQSPALLPDGAYALRQFRACIPVWGLNPDEKRQFVSVGGNLFSFDLLRSLWRESDMDVVHTHTLGRLGAIAAAAARRRGVPFVVSIHGGLLDLPAPMKAALQRRGYGGFDWGKFFGFLLKSRRLLCEADAILTCNPVEATLLRRQFSDKRVQVQPHGIPMTIYQQDRTAAAYEAWPQLRQRDVLLCAGRIDPVKNQGWVVEQARRVFQKHPNALLVLAGACTDKNYGEQLQDRVEYLGVGDRVLFTGGIPPGDPRLIGLLQAARLVILPSISETFGLVLLEAWAAGTTVLSSRTSGATSLIRHGENGWLFDLDESRTFHEALDAALAVPELRLRLAAAGHAKVKAEYDVSIVSLGVKQLYYQIMEAKSCVM